MKLKQVKLAREVKLPGVRVEFVVEDQKLVELILEPEGDQGSYSVRPGENYTQSIRIYQRLPYEVREVYRLQGKFRGLNVHEDFESLEAANRRVEELRQDDYSLDVSVGLIKVRVDESGELVKSSDILF